jgi:hypothetical protein
MDESEPNHARKRFWITFCILFGAMLVSVVWIRTIIPPNQRFDAEVWKNQSPLIDKSDVRLSMVNDLQKNILKQGMTRGEVHSLLGSKTHILPEYPDDMAYPLSSNPDSGATGRHGGSVHVQGTQLWLLLELDDRDSLTDWRVITR